MKGLHGSTPRRGHDSIRGSFVRCGAWFSVLFAVALGGTTAATAAVAAEAFDARVVAVGNADALRVMAGKDIEWIRLEGIFAPEQGQPFWEQAKARTIILAMDKVVRVVPKWRNTHQREFIAEVFLPDGRSLNQELVREGLAWWYSPHSRDLRLKELEIEARGARKNIWSELDPIPPWEFWKYRESRQTSRLKHTGTAAARQN